MNEGVIPDDHAFFVIVADLECAVSGEKDSKQDNGAEENKISPCYTRINVDGIWLPFLFIRREGSRRR